MESGTIRSNFCAAWLTLLTALPLLAASPGVEPLPIHCRKVEWNSFNPFGTGEQTAVVFWDFDGHVRDWRWASGIPEFRKTRPGHWEATWTENGKLLHVTAEKVTESHTKHDVEMSDRARWPESKRKKLVRMP